MTTAKPSVIAIRPADHNHQVLTITGGSGAYRKKPCPGCPWVKANAGSFPAEAFRHSANTATDMSEKRFGCHESGAQKPATCAGFLLRGADHNLAVRLDRMTGRIENDVTEGDRELFPDYRSMAVANGVADNDPAIHQCR